MLKKESRPLTTKIDPSEYVAFVHNDRDAALFNSFYADSAVVRVTLQNASDVLPSLKSGARTWIDAEIDGLHHLDDRIPQYKKYVERFRQHRSIVNPDFQNKPDASIVRDFVHSVLDACWAHSPSLISIPQLPMTGDAKRNKINRELAKAAGAWASGKRVSLVLPGIFTNQNQTTKKTSRNPKLSLIKQCVEASDPEVVWIVDCTLMDQDGSSTLGKRFQGLIELHQELLEILPTGTQTIGGPSWGLNIVLWARGLISFPAITLGNRYRYHLPGGRAQHPNVRIALEALKRIVVAKADLYKWLTDALKRIPVGDPANTEFATLLANFSAMLRGDNREQICRVYRKWLDSIATVPAPGRAVTLYQQLSSAYVLGRSLRDLPENGLARRPERTAQQLMLSCL
jgi:hypothetical protein